MITIIYGYEHKYFRRQIDNIPVYQNNSCWFFSLISEASNLPSHDFWPDLQHQTSIPFCEFQVKSDNSCATSLTLMPLLHLWVHSAWQVSIESAEFTTT